tara:strand:- start:149775 stop:150605 length:831 start_codon:yes stop_codon:yes gene_type:complete
MMNRLSRTDKRLYNETGYVTIDLGLSLDELKELRQDTLRLAAAPPKKQEGYEYSDSPRVFEGWKYSKAICNLALNRRVLETIECLHDWPNFRPFQTINFTCASNQPLHSDDIHFSSEPKGKMVGVWVALEDANEKNGALQVVPKSHKMPYISMKDVTGSDQPLEYGKHFNAYAQYESYVRGLLRSSEPPTSVSVPAGTAIIWHANLLHGGTPIPDSSSPPSRLSQATHYYAEADCYYSPLFSSESRSEYSLKDLSGKDFKDESNYEHDTRGLGETS